MSYIYCYCKIFIYIYCFVNNKIKDNSFGRWLYTKWFIALLKGIIAMGQFEPV